MASYNSNNLNAGMRCVKYFLILINALFMVNMRKVSLLTIIVSLLSN